MSRRLFRALGLCSDTGCSTHSWDPAGCVGCGRNRVDVAVLPSGEPWCTRCFEASAVLLDRDVIRFPQTLHVTWAEFERLMVGEVSAR